MSLSSLGKIMGEIGHGSFGTVYKMLDSKGKEFAVKEVKLDEWSRNEVAIQSDCCHPNVLPIQKVITTADNIYVVMPCCEYDVYSLMNSYMILDDQVKSYYSDVLNAVSYLHEKQIYHRDIKPENVMIYKKRAMLADFGLATMDKFVSDKSGTSMYCAPEVQAGKEYDASKQDMWSLGLLLINLLCAEDAWKSVEDPAYAKFRKDPKTFLKQLYPFSEEILEILLNLLNEEPSQRMEASELVEKFNKIEKFVEDVVFQWDEGVDVGKEDSFVVGSWDSALASSL